MSSNAGVGHVANALFAGPGEARKLARAVVWSATALGSIASWPDALRSATRICMVSPTPLCIWAGADFTLVHNDAYAPFLGAKAAWAMGRPAREVWAEIWDALEPEFSRVFQTGVAAKHEDERYVIRRHGGDEEGFFTFTLSPIPDESGNVVGLLNVSQESTSAVQLLRASEEKYRTLFETIDEGFCIIEVLFDEDGKPNDYRFVEVNSAFEKHTGLVHAAGKRVREMVPNQDEHWFDTFGRVALTGEPIRFQNRGEALNRHFDVYAFRVGREESRRIAVLFNDISERKRGEEELRRERDFTKAVIDTAGALVIVLDRDGTIQRFNRACEATTGYSADEATGRTLWDLGLIPPEELPGVRVVWDALVRGQFPNSHENRWVARDGSRPLIAWSNTALMGPDGKAEFIIAIGVDITERKRAEESLRQADQRKTEYLAVLSHELRNPLAPIRNSIYILERADPASEQAARAKEVVRRQTEHLTRLVDDLLDVTRISSGKIALQRARVDFRDIVRKTADDLHSVFAQSGVELRVDYVTYSPVWINADAMRMTQVLGNLLQNAVKFTPRGGSVTITVATSHEHAEIAVADTGIGMEPGTVEHMFEPFAQGAQTLARTNGGLGLGLALVKGLVELHGGTVQARSDGAGQGAEFVIRLPLDEPPEEMRADVPLSPEPTHRTVLIIEDNTDAGQTLADILELKGHRVRVARDATSGLALARNLRPDVVLCDIGLPDMDGYAIARALRRDEALRDMRLIALSGYAQPEDRQRSRDAGFAAHIAKPVDIDELMRVILS